MKTPNPSKRLTALIRASCFTALFLLALSASAQIFTNLHSFSGGTFSGITQPAGGLVLSGNTLYGTAQNGGSFNDGAVFAINTNGTGYTNLHIFTNSDGSQPVASLVLSGNTLYGTTQDGGSAGFGTIFSINTDGSSFTSLHSFTNFEYPSIGLIVSGNTLYGSAGNNVFALNTDGTGFTNLYTFTPAEGFTAFPFFGGTNSDGYYSQGLFLSGSVLYGTAFYGGSAGYGTVFAINTNGTGFTNLHNFTISDGGSPLGPVILSGDTLYGTTQGSAFAVNTNGTGFIIVHNFSSATVPGEAYGPAGGLILLGNALYGAGSGEISGNPIGGLFVVNTDGTGFMTFRDSDAGFGANHGLIASGNTLYGTTQGGGSSGYGTIFSFEIPIVFTASPTEGLFPLSVQFRSPAVDAAGNAITNWNWNFGDGSASTAQNPSHLYATSGILFPGLIATNNLGVAVGGIGPSILVAAKLGLVQNGGFETGDFTGWTFLGDTNDTFVANDSQSGITPHSGNYEVAGGGIGSPDYLSQTLTTTAGTSYLLSCWLNSPDGLTNNQFVVSWNGNTLFDQTNLAALGWTNLQFEVTATGTSTVLQFGLRDDAAFLALDDVSVQPLQPSIAGISLSGANLAVYGEGGLSGRTYLVLMSTNLTLPSSQWTPVATNALDADGIFTINATNAVVPNVPQCFYMLKLQ